MKSVRRAGALALALVLPFALTACGSSDDDSSSSGDGLKVVALGWSDGEIALDLGVKPIAIYDWQGYGEENKGVGPWAADKFGDTEPTVIKNTGTTYNYEQIELLEPDLILNVRASSDAKVLKRLSEIATVASAPEGTGDFAVDWRTQTEIIGKAIDKEAEAKKAIDATDAAISKAAEEHPEFKGKTFAYGVKFADAYGAYLKGDARFDVFASLGFEANPAVEKLQANGFFASVPAEQVKALDADVAVLSTIGMPLDDLKKDRLITSLGVVKDDRAVIVDETDEINTGLAAGTPQSIALAVEKAVPLLAAAAAKS